MTAVSAKDVKELRDRTDAPMMDCKNALVEASGDVEQAIKILKEKGKTKAAKRAGRETTQGAVAIKINEGNHGAAAVIGIAADDGSSVAPTATVCFKLSEVSDIQIDTTSG